MNWQDELDDLQYHVIRDYNYNSLFKDVQYEDKVLTREERIGYAHVVDETITEFKSGLPLVIETLERDKKRNDEFGIISNTVESLFLFTTLTMMDYLVASKYFILAEQDYDKRFMRGKLLVILNEGYKKLYGFDDKTFKKSEWAKIGPLMEHFPPIIHNQYSVLDSLLKQRSESSTWWRDERNYETHIEAEKLYYSRNEEIKEAKVMMEALKLYNALLAVHDFLTNVNACLVNTLINAYHRGELTEE